MLNHCTGTLLKQTFCLNSLIVITMVTFSKTSYSKLKCCKCYMSFQLRFCNIIYNINQCCFHQSPRSNEFDVHVAPCFQNCLIEVVDQPIQASKTKITSFTIKSAFCSNIGFVQVKLALLRFWWSFPIFMAGF